MSKKEKKQEKKEQCFGQKNKKAKDAQETKVENRQEQEKEYQALRERFLRLQADFDNYKKRSLQDKAEFIKFANHGLITELISILDNFELSVKYAEKKDDFKLMHQGVDMIIKQLHALLEAKGLKKMKTVGEKFDPYFHDALEIIEDESADTAKVVEEFQPGYLLSGKILRTAKVKVAKPKVNLKSNEKEEKEQEEAENQKQELKEKDKEDKE